MTHVLAKPVYVRGIAMQTGIRGTLASFRL